MRAPAPAPASTTTSTCERARRPTTSGTMATRFSPEAASLGTPSFMRRGSVPTDESVGLFAVLKLPVEFCPDAQRTQDRVRLVQVRGFADGQREACCGPDGGGDQEEERDGCQRGEVHRPPSIPDRDVAADAAEGAHGLGA